MNSPIALYPVDKNTLDLWLVRWKTAYQVPDYAINLVGAWFAGMAGMKCKPLQETKGRLAKPAAFN